MQPRLDAAYYYTCPTFRGMRVAAVLSTPLTIQPRLDAAYCYTCPTFRGPRVAAVLSTLLASHAERRRVARDG